MENLKSIIVAGFRFLIVNEVDYNYSHYLLAIDEAGENTIAVLKQNIVDGREIVESVDDQAELEAVLGLLNGNN